MHARSRWAALLLSAAPAVILPLRAEAADNGAIKGVITHKDTGKGVRGHVAIQCTCLQDSIVKSTSDSGLFVIEGLPAGRYTVEVFAGEARQVQVVELQRGQKMRVDFAVDPNDTIVRKIPVKGSSIKPATTRSGVVRKTDDYKDVPTASRGADALVETAPTAVREPGGISLGGGGVAEQHYTLGGGLTLDNPRVGSVSQGIVQELLEEVEVLEAGYEAELGNSSSGQIIYRRRSGSNKLRGVARFTFTPRIAKPRFILATDNAVRAIEVPDFQMQGVVQMSGPIIKDRLWWSGAVVVTGSRASLIQDFYSRVDKDGSGGYEGCPYENGTFDCVEGGDYIASKKFASQTWHTGAVQPQVQFGLDWAINPKHKLSFTILTRPEFQYRAYRRAPNANFDPSSFGTTQSTDPLGGGALVANGIVNGTFGWDRSNATNTSLEYNGRVARDTLEIDALLGYSEFATVEAWRLEDASLKNLPATLQTDAQGANLFALLDDEGKDQLVPGAEDACNDPDLPGLTCPVRTWMSGGIGAYDRERMRRAQGAFALTHFFEAKGAHQLKYGAQIEHIEANTESRYSGHNAEDFYTNCGPGQKGGGEWCYDPTTESYNVDTSTRVDNHRLIRVDTDNPNQRSTLGYGRIREEQGDLRAIATPIGSGARVDAYRAKVATQNYAIFLQDRWMLASNVYLNAGIRWELQDMRDVLGRRAVFIWDNVAPRVGLSYDWTDEGKSRLYASYGMFYQPMPLQLNSRVFGGLVLVGRTYRNNDCEAHPEGIKDGQPTEHCTDARDFTTGLTEGAVVPRLRGMFRHQFQMGYEHEVLEDLVLGVRWIHTDLGRAVEDVSTDGGNNFIIANPGVPVASEDIQRQQQKCDELDTELQGLMIDDPDRSDVSRELKRCEFLVDAYKKVGTIYSKPTQNFDSFTFEVRKRFAKNWMLVGNYTYARQVGNYAGYVDPITGAVNLGASTQYDTPELVRNSFGPLPNSVPHRFRVDAFYGFDLKEAGRLTLGTSVRVQSGYPVSVRANHSRYPGFPVNVLPRGSGGRIEPNYNWNLGLSYVYPLKDTLELEFAMRWINVTNAKAVLRVDDVYSYENARPVAGGDLSDLKHTKVQSSNDPTGFFQRGILAKQGNYGVEASFQNPTAAQFDVVLRF